MVTIFSASNVRDTSHDMSQVAGCRRPSSLFLPFSDRFDLVSGQRRRGNHDSHGRVHRARTRKARRGGHRGFGACPSKLTKNSPHSAEVYYCYIVSDRRAGSFWAQFDQQLLLQKVAKTWDADIVPKRGCGMRTNVKIHWSWILHWRVMKKSKPLAKIDSCYR